MESLQNRGSTSSNEAMKPIFPSRQPGQPQMAGDDDFNDPPSIMTMTSFDSNIDSSIQIEDGDDKIEQ